MAGANSTGVPGMTGALGTGVPASPSSVRTGAHGTGCTGPDADDPGGDPPSGALQPVSAKVLMKFLYGARVARPDLLRAICHLASCVTKWTEQCDRDLFRLVCYAKTTASLTLTWG